MANFLLDFTGVDLDKNDFEPIPPGTYPARIDTEQVELRVDGKGNRYFAIKYVLEHPDYEGRAIYQNYWVEGEPDKRLGRMLRNLGFDVSSRVALNTAELHGKRVVIKVVQNAGRGTNSGKIYNNVEEVLPRSQPQQQQLFDTDVAEEW